jgi:MFS family permease
MSVQGAGSILAGLLVAALMRRIGETAVVAVAMAGFAVGAAGLAVHSDAAVAAAAFVIGFAVSCYAVGFGTALQRYTPPRLQGRVSTATFVLTDIPQTASIAAGAALIATVDYRLLLAVLSVVTLACAVALARAAYRPVCPMPERVAGGV